MEFVYNLAERGLDTNSLFFGTSAKNLNKLQRVQNWAGRIVGGSQRTGWHPFLHSNFISYIGYMCEPGSNSNCWHCIFDHERWMICATSLLLLQSYQPPLCTLRLSSQHLLTVPRCRTVVGRQSAILGCRASSMEQSCERIETMWNFGHFKKAPQNSPFLPGHKLACH